MICIMSLNEVLFVRGERTNRKDIVFRQISALANGKLNIDVAAILMVIYLILM